MTRWAKEIRRGIGALVIGMVAAGCGSGTSGSPAAFTAVPAPTSTPLVTPFTTPGPSVPPSTQSPSGFVYPLADAPGWIVDQTGSPEGGAVIRLVRPDGTDRHLVATDVPDRFHLHPEWSADGSGFTFLTTDAPDGSRSIWRYDMASEVSRRLVDCSDPCVDATEQAESPDGSRIAYFYADGPTEGVKVEDEMLEIPTSCGIRILDITTETSETLTTHACATVEERYPRWSPSGTHLAYLRTTSESRAGPVTGSEIVIRELSTAKERVAVAEDGDAYDMLDWSADGRTIVVSTGGGIHRVYADDGSIDVIARPDPRGATHPRVTSDGEWVLFYRTETSPSGEVIARSLWGALGGEPAIPILPVAPPGPDEGHTTWGSLQPEG